MEDTTDLDMPVRSVTAESVGLLVSGVHSSDNTVRGDVFVMLTSGRFEVLTIECDPCSRKGFNVRCCALGVVVGFPERIERSTRW